MQVWFSEAGISSSIPVPDPEEGRQSDKGRTQWSAMIQEWCVQISAREWERQGRQKIYSDKNYNCTGCPETLLYFYWAQIKWNQALDLDDLQINLSVSPHITRLQFCSILLQPHTRKQIYKTKRMKPVFHSVAFFCKIVFSLFIVSVPFVLVKSTQTLETT